MSNQEQRANEKNCLWTKCKRENPRYFAASVFFFMRKKNCGRCRNVQMCNKWNEMLKYIYKMSTLSPFAPLIRAAQLTKKLFKIIIIFLANAQRMKPFCVAHKWV